VKEMKNGAKKLEVGKRKLVVRPTIPRSITLVGLEIETKYDENMLSDREFFGEWCPRTMDITIAKNAVSQRQLLAYCHELVEAIVDIYDIDVKEREKQALGLAFYELLMQGKLYTVVEESDTAD
jgi:hypothetical protein